MNTPHALTAGSNSCQLKAEQSQPVSLSDGSLVTIDASSIASNGRSVMIAGTPTVVWPPKGLTPPSSDNLTPTIGVVRDTSGTIHLIPAPLRGIVAHHPRVVSAGSSGWHVLFASGEEGSRGNPLLFANATIWYGRFDGRAWHDIERISDASFAALLPTMSSDLVSSGSDLAFAYAFDRSMSLGSNAAGNQGLVVIRGRSGRWTADTLLTWEAPRFVQLAEGENGRLLALFSQSYFSERRSHGPSLFAAVVDSAWQPPWRAVDVSDGYVWSAALALAEPAVRALAWTQRSHGSGNNVLSWGLASSDGSIQQLGKIVSVGENDRPAAVRLTNDRTLFLTRSGASRRAVSVFLTIDTTVQSLGDVDAPFDNFTLRGLLLQDGRVLLLTGGINGASEADPPASYLTTITVGCTTARN